MCFSPPRQSLQGRPDLSLSILLQLRSPDVFDFIDVHSLVSKRTHQELLHPHDLTWISRGSMLDLYQIHSP